MEGIRDSLILQLCASATLSFGPVIALAQDGVLDPTFGSGGLIEIYWPAGSAEANAVGADSTGRIVIGGDAIGPSGNGDFSLFRLLADGTLDISFANDNLGFRLVDFDLDGIGGRSFDTVNDLTVLNDDSIVAAGEAHFGLVNSQFALVKLDSSGALDTSFGQGGSAHFGFNTFQSIDQASLLRADSSGRILVAGTVVCTCSDLQTYDYWFGLARLTPLGQFDATFSRYFTIFWADKSTFPPTRAQYNFPSAITLDSQQRVVSVGTFVQPFPQDVAVMRGTPDGGYDPTFGTQATGRVRLNLSTGTAGGTVAIANGQLMVSGSYGDSMPDTPFLMRLNEDGSIDTGFGNSGTATTPPLGNNESVNFNFLAQTKNGAWLLAGQYAVATGSFGQLPGVMLVRFDANGNPDPTFGTNGIVAIAPDQSRAFVPHRAFLQTDGKLLVAGSMPNSTVDNTTHFAVIRILADNTIFANGFEAP